MELLNHVSILLKHNKRGCIVLIERCDLLDSNLLSRRLVQRRTHDTVCALANNILDVILLADVEGDLAGTALRRSARHLVGIASSSKYGL